MHFQALGCRLNEAELEQWSSELLLHGHRISPSVEQADVVVFNSCSVTAEADRKSRQLINRIHTSNPSSRLVVTGCYASLQQEKVRQQLGVDLVLPNQAKDDLVATLLEHWQAEENIENQHHAHPLFERGRQRAFIKIQDGCRYRCTFCTVTLARGEERSRGRGQILHDIQRIHQDGVKEVVLTGVHVGGYGSDSGDSLYALIAEILDKTEIPRLRLASVEPWDLPDNFFDLFTEPRLMPHMHLPLQSGSDSVLRRMARRCKTAEFSRLVDQARSSVSGFNVTTDIIVGFPGEDDREWQQTLDFVEQTGFGHVHVFSYSPREGTKAATLPGQVAPSEKKLRSAELRDLASKLKLNALRRMLGTDCDVLWEQKHQGVADTWVGYTPQYHRIVSTNENLASADISRVRVSDLLIENEMLVGEAV